MTPEQLQSLAGPEGAFIFDRMFSAVQKVRERLERACRILGEAGIPYAVVGGHAVAAWVATKDDGAVRNTEDVDLLLREEDLQRATVAMELGGFVRQVAMNVTMFLDGREGKPSQAVHVLLAQQKVKAHDACPTPSVDQVIVIDDKRIVELSELVRMKLTSYRRKDQTHVQDMIGVGLIDGSWPARFETPLNQRLQDLLDDPEG